MNPLGIPLGAAQLPGAALAVLRISRVPSGSSPLHAHTICGRAGSASSVMQFPPLPDHAPVNAASLLSCQLAPPSELRQMPRSYEPAYTMPPLADNAAGATLSRPRPFQ